jgi:uncharacterized phage protein (TIGR01671 family)
MMSREIKFEICVVDREGKISYTDIHSLDRLLKRNGTLLNVGEKVLWKRQYTGLKDKHGKEIYESDIIKVHYGIPPTYSILEVIWKTDRNKDCEKICGYGLVNDITGWWYKDHSHGNDAPMFINDDFEIIGNIYENPELLKEGEE